jgi:uncharacterized membrane protein YfcA
MDKKSRNKRILVAVISATAGGFLGSYVGGLINPEVWVRVLGAFVGAVALGTLIPALFLKKK